MTPEDWLAGRFEEQRGHLSAVAYRMLGSAAEADDAVQESWLRLSRTDTSDVQNLAGWLTTVVARVCLDMLRSRRARREEPQAALGPEDLPGEETTADPEQEALLSDSVGLALLIVLDKLAPAERTAFVLHDMFDVPFDDIGTIVGRSPAAARQLASRARRRVRGASTDTDPAVSRQHQVVEAFLAASRAGDFEALLDLLDPDAELRADATVTAMGPAEVDGVHGAAAVAATFSGRARVLRLALLDGAPGAVWTQGGQPQIAFGFTVADGKITRIDFIGDREALDEMELEYLDRRD
jgi:RNA polymerase sigma-70 factor, ECF subfamily